jgi:hypothetical protein
MVLALVLGTAGLAPAPAWAQNAGLSGLLLRFFQGANPIELVTTNHPAHFGAQPGAQTIMTGINRSIASQIATFPLGSSSGGFAYTFDPELGVFSRSTESFGPLFAERALTIGRGKLGFGITYLHSNYDSFEGQNLHNGDLAFYLQHRDINRDNSHLNPYFEGDRIQGNLFLELETDTTVFFGNYGVTDKLDVGFAIPLLRIDMTARMHYNILHVSTGPDPVIFHTFPGPGIDVGNPATGVDESDVVHAGTVEGLGDLVARAKYQVKRYGAGGLAIGLDLRLPTGDEQELLGSGATQAKLFAIASGGGRKFSPHLNFGYTFSTGGGAAIGELPDEINYTAGFDAALLPRLTLTADIVGRTLLDTERVAVREETWDFVTRDDVGPDPANPVNVQFTAFPRLTPEPGDLNLLIGAVGLKLNPFGNFLISGNVLLSQGKRGLQDYVTPVVSVDYSF